MARSANSSSILSDEPGSAKDSTATTCATYACSSTSSSLCSWLRTKGRRQACQLWHPHPSSFCGATRRARRSGGPGHLYPWAAAAWQQRCSSSSTSRSHSSEQRRSGGLDQRLVSTVVQPQHEDATGGWGVHLVERCEVRTIRTAIDSVRVLQRQSPPPAGGLERRIVAVR